MPARRINACSGFLLALAVSVHGVAVAQSDPREVPDYDGRGDDPTTPGEVALWAPRILFAPLYLVAEYGLRQPSGAATRTFGPADNAPGVRSRRSARFLPTFYGDWQMRPRIGLYVDWEQLFVERHALQIHADFWGKESVGATLVDRVMLVPDRVAIALTASAEKRDDFVFAGLGPRSDDEDLARYQARRGESRLALEWTPSARIQLVGWTGARIAHFDPGDSCCGEPTVMERVGNRELEVPPGFEEGYGAWIAGGRAAVDTRRNDTRSGTGVRLVARAEHALDLDTDADSRWVRWGASASGIVDLTGTRRELSLSLDAAFADPLGTEPVPFTEQATLGGDSALPAFLPGRLVDRSAAAATLAYTWPIWIWLDAQLHVAAGNVAGPALRDFEPAGARLSLGVALLDRYPDGYLFRTLVALGTEPLDEGATPTTVRVLFEVGHAL